MHLRSKYPVDVSWEGEKIILEGEREEGEVYTYLGLHIIDEGELARQVAEQDDAKALHQGRVQVV
jgi:hypothetical protein